MMVLKNKCPKCGTSPCQISFMGHIVECSNEQCVNYCADLYPRPLRDTLVPTPTADEVSCQNDSASDANSQQLVVDDNNVVASPAINLGGESPLPEVWLDGHYDFGDC